MIRGMFRNLTTGIVVRVKGYVRTNWGAPFVAGFILLLMVAAVCLSLGLGVLAEAVAVPAYIALVIGVVLQLICLRKYDKGNSEMD